MKIVLASALFPPDIAPPAPYVKELARRLASTHQLTVLVYGRLPEQVRGVEMISVSKRRPLPLRLISYTRALWRATRDADVLFVENGPSVELPTLFVTLFSRTPLYLHFGDEAAQKRADDNFFLHLLGRILQTHARAVIAENPLNRPEILPFEPRPERALQAYEASWSTHVQAVEKLFTHATH